MNKTLLFLIAFFLILNSCKEELPLTLNEGEFVNEVHKNNTGKILFMNDWIPIDSFS